MSERLTEKLESLDKAVRLFEADLLSEQGLQFKFVDEGFYDVENLGSSGFVAKYLGIEYGFPLIENGE